MRSHAITVEQDRALDEASAEAQAFWEQEDHGNLAPVFTLVQWAADGDVVTRVRYFTTKDDAVAERDGSRGPAAVYWAHSGAMVR